MPSNGPLYTCCGSVSSFGWGTHFTMQPPVIYAFAKQSTRPRQVDTTFCRDVGKRHIMHVKGECVRKVSVHGNKDGIMLLTSLQYMQTWSYTAYHATSFMHYATSFKRAMIHFKYVSCKSHIAWGTWCNMMSVCCMQNLPMHVQVHRFASPSQEVSVAFDGLSCLEYKAYAPATSPTPSASEYPYL